MSYDFVYQLGTDFTRVISYQDSTGTPINLSGFTAHMEVRPTVTNSSKILDITPTVDGSAGTITIHIPHTQVINLNLIHTEEKTLYENGVAGTGKTGVYDLLITGSGVTTKILDGQFVFVPTVTR